MNTQDNERNAGRAFLGFLITFFMIWILIGNGIIMSVKTTILSGSNIDDVLENTNIFGTITDVVVQELTASTENEDGSGLSAEAVQAVFSEEVLQDVSETLTDALREDKEVDMSNIKDQCMDSVEQIAHTAIDDIINEIQSSSNVISVDSLKNSETLQKLEKDYNVDVTTVITDYVEDTYESDSISLEDVDLEQLRTEAKASVSDTVIPVIEEAIDEHIVEINESVNESIQEVNREYDISGIIKIIEAGLGILNVVMIAAVVVVLLFALLEIFAVYKKAKNKGFKNIAVAGFFSGIVTVLVSAGFGIILSMAFNEMGNGTDAVEKAVMELLNVNLTAIVDRLRLIGIVYIVVAVVCVIAAIVIKKKKNVDASSDMFAGTTGGVA